VMTRAAQELNLPVGPPPGFHTTRQGRLNYIIGPG